MASLDASKQPVRRCAEGVGNREQPVNCERVVTVLDVHIERAVKPGIERQALLSEANFMPLCAKVVPQIPPPAGGSLGLFGHFPNVGTVLHLVCSTVPTFWLGVPVWQEITKGPRSVTRANRM